MITDNLIIMNRQVLLGASSVEYIATSPAYYCSTFQGSCGIKTVEGSTSSYDKKCKASDNQNRYLYLNRACFNFIVGSGVTQPQSTDYCLVNDVTADVIVSVLSRLTSGDTSIFQVKVTSRNPGTITINEVGVTYGKWYTGSALTNNSFTEDVLIAREVLATPIVLTDENNWATFEYRFTLN